MKSWSTTQKSIALSSGEAELIALVKMSTELIGLAQLAEDWGMPLKGVVYADSSAALGVVSRKGSGRLRHVKVGSLWVQEKKNSGEILYKKVDGKHNPGDLMTKNGVASTRDEHTQRLGLEVRTGRAALGLSADA